MKIGAAAQLYPIFDDIDSLLCYYADYEPLWNCNSYHILDEVRSQSNVCAWREMLLGDWNCELDEYMDPDALFLLNGVSHVEPISSEKVNSIG